MNKLRAARERVPGRDRLRRLQQPDRQQAQHDLHQHADIDRLEREPDPPSLPAQLRLHHTEAEEHQP